MTQVIELPAGHRDAELRAASFNQADNTIECCWTTGATVRRSSWLDGPFDEELIVSANAVRLGRMNAGAPLLDSHMGMSARGVFGTVVAGTARLEGGLGLARVKLSTAPGDADMVHKIREGVIRNVSVGYVRHRIEKIEKKAAVPVWRVVDWEPFEISACAMPHDAGAQFRSVEGDKHRCLVVGSHALAAAARMKLRRNRAA